MLWSALFGVLAALVMKRDVRTILQVRFRWPYLLLLGFVGQFGFWMLAQTGLEVSPWALQISFFVVLVGLALNLHIRGVPWVLAGAVLNFVAIAAHGGAMPVSVSAWSWLHGPSAMPQDSRHMPMSAGDSLWWLGDWMPVVRYVLSPGDILVAIGIIWFVVSNAHKRGTA